MINRNTSSALPNYIPKYSDADIIRGLINSEYWQLVYSGSPKATWIAVREIIYLKMEMFVSPLRAVLRINHGKRTIGLIIYLMTILMMIAFNTKYLLGYLATFFPFAAPAVPFLLTLEQMCEATFITVYSKPLMYFWIAYGALGLIHMLRIHKGWGKAQGNDVHGSSIIHMLVARRLGLSETFSKVVLEPLLILGVALFLIQSGMDKTLGLFLLIGGGCLFWQEGRNVVMRFGKHQN